MIPKIVLVNYTNKDIYGIASTSIDTEYTIEEQILPTY